MKNRLVIIANGPVKDEEFHKKILKDADVIICADGGANTTKKLGFTPDYIVGDLDSIEKNVYDFFDEENKTKIIKDEDQNKTDLELAIKLAETLNPSEIKIIGAVGRRIDHTLANILTLDQISRDIKAVIIDEHNSIELAVGDVQLNGKKDDIVSVVPLTEISNLCYNGFRWNVDNIDTKLGWFGISNMLESSQANISFSKGKILVIKVRK